MTALLVSAGATESDALAAVLVWRALTYFPQIFIGIFTFLWWRHLAGKEKKLAAATG